MAPKIPPKKTFKEQAKVLFQYTAENEDELTIKEGDIINIISKQIEDKGWMKGELNGKIGVFPDNFVEILPNTSLQSNPTTNNFQKSTTNNFINNGTNDSPPKLPATKKPIPETKLSKSITNKFNEIISKSNNSINETSTPKSLFNLSTKQIDDSINNKSTINQAPNLPVKKTKLFTTPKPSFHQRESSEENLDKQDDLNSFIDEPNNLSPIKLTHLTANRNKGPTRRPPSIIQIPKDDELSLTSSNSLNNLNDLNDNKNNSNLDDQLNKELNNKINNKTSETMLSKTTTNQPPWMLELKKTQAEKKNVEVGKMKKNFSLTDETNTTTNTSTSNLNGNSPNSSKKLINQSPNSPTKLTNTPITATPFNHRMSGDYTSRFKEFLQQQPTTQNSTNVNSLSRHSSVNNHHNFNSSRTLSTDSLDCKQEQTSLGFGNLTSPFKPIKAAKPTVNKFISGSPTTTNNFLSNSNLNSSNNQLINNNQINKDLVSRKEFDELQKRVNDLTDIVENQKQIYKGLVTDLINDIAEEKKKVANLSIEVDRLRKLTTTV